MGRLARFILGTILLVALLVGAAALVHRPTPISLGVDVTRVSFATAEEINLLPDVAIRAFEIQQYETATFTGNVLQWEGSRNPGSDIGSPQALNKKTLPPHSIEIEAGSANLMPSVRFGLRDSERYLGSFSGVVIQKGAHVTMETIGDEARSLRVIIANPDSVRSKPSGSMGEIDLVLPDTVMIGFEHSTIAAIEPAFGKTRGAFLATLSRASHTKVSPGARARVTLTLELPAFEDSLILQGPHAQLQVQDLEFLTKNDRAETGYVGSILDGEISFPLHRKARQESERISSKDNLTLRSSDGFALHSMHLRDGRVPAIHLEFMGRADTLMLGPRNQMRDLRLSGYESWMGHPILGVVTKSVIGVLLAFAGGITIRIASKGRRSSGGRRGKRRSRRQRAQPSSATKQEPLPPTESPLRTTVPPPKRAGADDPPPDGGGENVPNA